MSEINPRECILCYGELGAVVFPYGTRWRDRVFKYRRCRDCASKVISPLPSADDLRAMYGHDQYHAEYYDISGEITPTTLEEIYPLLNAEGRILDFGCGIGHFLRIAKSLGFRAEGVELDPKTRAVASRNSGCEVHALEELEESRAAFDVIHMGDVLEHLVDPAGMFRRLEELLTPGGLFFIEGPVEDNPSLVYGCSLLFGSLKALTGRNLLADSPPTHLSRLTARRQRRFFENDLGYETRLFRVFETGWPYLISGPLSDGPLGFRGTIRTAIGKSAVWLASSTAALGLGLGNRFTALVRRRTF